MSGQSLADKAFGSFQVPISAEQELDGIAVAVDGTIEIKPLTFDLHIGLIQIPFTGDRTLLPIETLKQHGAEMQNPAMDCGMFHRDAAGPAFLSDCVGSDCKPGTTAHRRITDLSKWRSLNIE